MQGYCFMSARQALAELRTTREGLTSSEAERRRKEYGANTIEAAKKVSPAALFFSQFKDVMTVLLIAAAVISAVVAFVTGDSGDLTDTFIIVAIIFLNAIVGTVQQYRADKAIDGLKKLSATYAKVRRGGKVISVNSSEVTVGDIVVLEEGDLVPADCRIISSSELKCDESALTGEAQGVEKRDGTITERNVQIGSVYNMLFGSTYVLSGSAEAVVTGVGRNTQIGEIADMLDGAKKDKTPLEKNLDKLGKIISGFVLAVATLIFVMSVFVRGGGVLKSFTSAVAVAVAAIPEGLTAVVTVIMAMGVQRMSRENVIIRKLKCVEALGGCSCICTDKTGTLTQNKMRVTALFCDLKTRSPQDITGVNALFCDCIGACTHVKGEKGAYIGDPTEIALKLLSDEAERQADFEIADEIPFTSERKKMSVAVSLGGKTRTFTKGAPDVVIKSCTRISVDGEVRTLTSADREKIVRAINGMSDAALRVLAFAYCDGEKISEEDMVFLGLCGMADGLKKGVKEAVEDCNKAGITTVMITGDHARTAFAIAKKAGIASDFSEVVSGEELDGMSKPERAEAIRRCKVFARVSPRHKNLIVKIKRSAGEVVAMTGDGVNDAPPIKSADIGIAMGESGTDVTKNVADMVIADDNFTTIVTAVKEGRRISSNVKKTILFFLSTNLAEVFSILFATLVFFKYDFLLSTQLLWINLITDSFPVLALGVERGDFGAMSRPPEKTEHALFSKSSVFIIASSALFISGLTVGVFAFALANYGNAVATTMTFIVVSFAELLQAFNIRTERRSAFGKGALSNKILLVTVALGVILNVVLCVTPLAPLFGLVALNGMQWLIVSLVSLSVLLFGEAYKLVLKIASSKKKHK